MNIDMNMIKDKLSELDDLLQNTTNDQKDKIKAVMKDVVPTFKEEKNQ